MKISFTDGSAVVIGAHSLGEAMIGKGGTSAQSGASPSCSIMSAHAGAEMKFSVRAADTFELGENGGEATEPRWCKPPLTNWTGE